MIDFIEYLQEEGLKPERKGLSWWMSCPHHQDNTPSMQISNKNGSYVHYCFSCKRGGGPASFISEYKGIPEHEARKVWARLTDKELPDTERDIFTRAIESLAVNGHNYLRSRGITDDTCKKFGIGYCEDYYSFLKVVGLTDDEAKSMGIFDFSGCIIYPFYDSEGIYKIAARSIEEKRYNNSSKDSKWHRDGLWGLNLLRGDTAWVFEGYHDAMVARQSGLQSIAACGTNMTQGMWEELRSRNITRVIFAPDGDAGGRDWLKRLAVDAPQDITIEFVALDHGDPDDAILAGTFRSIKPQVPYEWLISKEDISELASKIRVVKLTAKAFLRMPKDQRVLCRSWFKDKFGDDEALNYINVDIIPDFEAERVVLANCLYSKNARLEATRELEEWHFNGKVHKNIWVLIRDSEATPQMIQVTIGQDLSESVDLVNYRFYIDRVKDIGTRAKVSRVLASANPSNIGDVVEDLYAVVDKVSVIDSADLAAATIEDINRRVNDPKVLGVPILAFPTLNKVLLGLVPGRLILVSGNSGHGKTTMACNIINDLIDDNETLFLSLEMTEKEIMEKLICIRSGIPSMKIATGSLEQAEYDKVVETAELISRSKLQVVYGVNDLYKAVALIRAHAMRRKTRFVVIDYTQLMTVSGGDERWEQLAKITKTFKTQICGKLGITMLAISQLAARALKSDVPDAADQAGAYAMLADADHAITVRKMDPKETKDGSNFLVHVSKNRFGLDSIIIPAYFDRSNQRISELI